MASGAVLRIIYIYIEVRGTIYLVTAYAKNVRENLNADDLKALRKLAKELKEE